MNLHPTWPLRYGVALLATTLATVIMLWIAPSFEYGHSALFISAVMIAAWYGGMGPGLLANVLSTLAIDYYITPPYHSIASYADDLLELIIFFLLSLLISYLTARRRAAETALLESNQALTEANEKLASANRIKGEFLAMLSHELRNQLAPLHNAAQVLKLAETDRAATRRQRELIDRQVTHLARLIDDLLDVSRLGRGKLRLVPQRLDLREVVDQAIEAVAPALRERGHELTNPRPTAPLWVQGDPTRLVQIMVNLLLNANKYSEPGSPIELAWNQATAWDQAVSRDDGPGRPGRGPWVMLSVRDHGIGIAPDLLPHIFELFAQAEHSPERAQGGLGIGLALVRGLVEMHGGTIEARSAGLGQGSEFILRFPLEPDRQREPADGTAVVASDPLGVHGPEAPAAAMIPVPDGAPRRLRVLIVDDVADAAHSLAELLELCGCATTVAGDGREALETARGFLPDVVLLDIGLPGENGYVVARRLRQEPGLALWRLIALTGYGSQEDQQRAREVGFDGHLTKPVDLPALKRVLGEVADRNEAIVPLHIPA